MEHNEYKPTYNRLNGQFLKGHEPCNKGKPWNEWLPVEAQKKIIKNLNKVRPKGGNPIIPGYNRKKVVMVTPKGNWAVFESAAEAGRKMNLIKRNITHCCQGKRHKCGGRWWFYWDDDRWPIKLREIQKELEESNSQSI